ncbi:MAG: radical SAM protein [Lachnospiraceae bacterium]|nr:radical SAM protein [Lachnospiraceae bacterium]
MVYEGDVYRPPSEAHSLIIQVTIGCSHNTCTFCYMYTDKRFRIRKREEILQDLEECSRLYKNYVRRVFFADGDALIVRTELLLELLEYVRTHFPYAERVTAYGTASDVLRKSEDELKALRAAGLTMVYLGAESGDDDILLHIKKGQTAQELIDAGQKLKRCGIQTSVTLISGLGGPEGMERHALASARLINEMNPEYASILSLQVPENTPMAQEIACGEMRLLTADETVDETEIFLRAIDSPGTVFRSNHASNYVALAGTFNQDIPAMLAQLEEAKKRRQYRPDWMRAL